MDEFKKMSNIPEKIKIGNKNYTINSPVIGVAQMVKERLDKIFKIIDFDWKKYLSEKVGTDIFIKNLLASIYRSLENSKETINLMEEIITLLINNKPMIIKKKRFLWILKKIYGVQITPYEIDKKFTIKEFIPFLMKLLEMTDVTDFLLNALRLTQQTAISD